MPAGVVIFAPGEARQTIAVSIAGDTAFESDESSVVTLSTPSAGLAVETATAAGLIVNDDAIVSLAAVSASQDEGHAGATVFVFAPTLLGDLPQAIAANIDPVYIGAPAFEMHGVRPVAASRKSRWRPACTFCCARNIGRNGCPAVTTSKGQGFATDFRDPTLRRH